MSRSSVAWKPSFEGSSPASALARIADAPFLLAVRDAFPWGFGGLLISLAVIWLLVHRVSVALLPSFGVMAVVLAIALPITLARRTGYALALVLPASLIAFAIMLPQAPGLSLAYLQELGPTGIFLAILASGVVAAALAVGRFVRPSHIRLGALRLAQGDIASIAALGTTMSALAIIVFVLHVDVSREIALALQPLARLGDSYVALLLIVAAQMLLWLCGVHGSAMLSAILTPVYLTMQMENTAAFAVHLPLPHVVVSSLFLFVFPGGSGATLPLALLLAISRLQRLRRIGRIALLPALANANEPLLFGLPVVLNPFFAVPFLLAPLVVATVSYAAIALGFVARPAFYVPPFVPAPISTYLATLDPRAPLLLLVNLVIAALIYLPFLRAYERRLA